MVEIWKAIPSMPDYEASTLGRLRHVRIVGAVNKETGYVGVWNGIRTIAGHLLVAEAFMGKKPAGMQVNHKNGIKSDNSPANLEYVTPAQNVHHAIQTGLVDHDRKRKPMISFHRANIIRHLKALGGVTYPELSRVFKLAVPTLRNIIKNRTHTCDYGSVTSLR